MTSDVRCHMYDVNIIDVSHVDVYSVAYICNQEVMDILCG